MTSRCASLLQRVVDMLDDPGHYDMNDFDGSLADDIRSFLKEQPDKAPDEAIASSLE